MFPTDEVYGTWAASGEIDIMELVGHEPNRVHGTTHFGSPWPANQSSGGAYTLPSGSFNDGFHTFAVEWEETEIRWFVDGILYRTQTSWWSSGGAYPAPFNERFFLILNCAVGGNWPGSPNGSTQFPQDFVIDYVRGYQEVDHDLLDCVCVFDDMEHGNPNGNGYFNFSAPSAGGGINGNLIDVPPIGGGGASLEPGAPPAPPATTVGSGAPIRSISRARPTSRCGSTPTPARTT
jgi:beta-glucanase (GH16 family)